VTCDDAVRTYRNRVRTAESMGMLKFGKLRLELVEGSMTAIEERKIEVMLQVDYDCSSL